MRFERSSWALSSIARVSGGYALAGATRGDYHPQVLMLGRDGAPAAGFGPGGLAIHPLPGVDVRGLEVDARGGFVLAGGIRDTQSTGLVRFSPGGGADLDFGDKGLTSISAPWHPGFRLDPGMTRQCDGRLLVVGGDADPSFTLAGLEPGGARDTRFGVNGLVRFGPVDGTSTFHAYAVLVHPRDGRITVVTAWNNDRGIALWRFWP